MTRLMSTLLVLLLTNQLDVAEVQNAVAREGEQKASEVMNFVRQRYVHGLPEERARSLGVEAVSTLGSMLQDNAEKRSWPNIVESLGYIGGAKAKAILLGFLFNPSRKGAIDHDEFQALALVPLALGHIGGGDKGAQDYLELLVDIDRTPVKNFAWYYDSYRDGELVKIFAETGVSGLGLVGNENADKFLRQFRVRVLSDSRQKFLLDDVDSAIKKLEALGKGEEKPRRVDEDGQVDCGASSSAGLVSHGLSVTKNSRLSLTKGEVDQVLKAASVLLQKNDQFCPEEIECPVALIRAGGLDEFGTPQNDINIINNDDQLQRVLMVGGGVKVVDSIFFCEGESKHFPGCTLGRSSVIEKNAAPDVWGHEFGHTQGLRDIHQRCAGRIMDGGGYDTKAVDRNECVCFSRPLRP